MTPPPERSSLPGQATALWLEAAGTYSLRQHKISTPGHDEVTVRALFSAVSRGTERLVMEGRVPPSEAERMRCPYQAGDFPFPVKYGYALVGEVEDGAGPPRTVFLLHPHQSAAVVPAAATADVPAGVPARRATLGANMETALNVVWDSGAAPGDRVLVVGAGVVGLLVARLLARMPGVEVTVADIDPAKRAVVEAMGATFGSATDVDVAINASGTDAGLGAALEAAGLEARVVEASWHGAGRARLELGGAFHSQRLTIASSQVGRIPAARAPRWTHARRLAAALRLLDDMVLDVLVTHEVPFAEAPARLPGLLSDGGALAVVLSYPPGDRARG